MNFIYNELTITVVLFEEKKELLFKCLHNIKNFKVIIIDNAGNSELRAQVQEEFAIKHYILNKKNYGFTKAANQAIKLCNTDYILNINPKDVSALYNLGNVMGSMDNWIEAKKLFAQAASSNNAIAMARSSEALAIYQLGDLELAEKKIRILIRKYPLFADARAALSALLWSKGFSGEAESNWAAAAGLDIRYREKDWLLNIRRWPPRPTNDLIAFLALDDK